jgi:hypothetical protein
MPMGSGDFAHVKLCFSGLINQNRAAFATGVMAEAATERWLSVGRVPAKSPTSRKEREKWGIRQQPTRAVLRNIQLPP